MKMKNLFNGSRIAIEGENRIYVQGDYTPWHNEDEDILEGQDCPLVYENLELLSIDEDGLWLEQKTDKSLLEDNTWCLYETDCTGVKENYLDAEILKKELGVEEKVLYLIHTDEILEQGCPMPIWEVLTGEELDKKPDSCFDEYWKGTTFTEINSIKEFESHHNNFCQAQDDMMSKIYNFFGGK
jgi:hypothetical protein